MSNIYHSISKKLAVLNIDYYHYEDVLRCYSLAKLNIEHSKHSDYTDGINTEEFATEVSKYHLLPVDVNHFYEDSTFFLFAETFPRQVWIKIANCFLNTSHPSSLQIGTGL